MGVQGGILQLITRDARNDQYLQADLLLRQRLARVKQQRTQEQARRQAAGDPTWAAYVTEPTFADVECTHRLYVHQQYRPFCAVASEYAKVPGNNGTNQLTGADAHLTFQLPTFGDFLADMVLHIQLAGVGAAGGGTRYEYTHYPGIRLIKQARFVSDRVEIDSYTRDDVLFVDKFWVDPRSRDGWDRCMGEQVAQTGEFWNSNEYTASFQYKEGPQTRREEQPPLDLWIPLQFSTSRDVAQAIPNDMIPNSQRAVELTLAPLTDLLRARDAAGNVVPLPTGILAFKTELYVNSLYVNPEIHDLFAARLGFTLIRIHRTQVDQITATRGAIELNRVKFPAEYLQVGVRTANASADFDRWHLFGRRRVRSAASALLAAGAVYNAGLGLCQLVCRTLAETTSLDPVVDSLHVTAGRGIELFPDSGSAFYQAYLPTRWRTVSPASAPKDRGVLLVPFGLYPGRDEVSGYINLSAEREVRLEYLAPGTTPSNPAEAVIAVAALNFLVRDGDSIRLRYST